MRKKRCNYCEKASEFAGEIECDKSIVYTDKWKADDGIVLDGYKHTRINHSKIIAERKNHLN